VRRKVLEDRIADRLGVRRRRRIFDGERRTELVRRTRAVDQSEGACERLILKKLGLEKGSTKAQNKVAKLTKQQVEEIATEKMEDLNAADLDAAKRLIAGTARSMGIDAA
jgi:ribosomal protein L11